MDCALQEAARRMRNSAGRRLAGMGAHAAELAGSGRSRGQDRPAAQSGIGDSDLPGRGGVSRNGLARCRPTGRDAAGGPDVGLVLVET